MNDIKSALISAGVVPGEVSPPHNPLKVLVMVEEYNGEPVKVIAEYVFDYNNDNQRRVFAAQAHNALLAGQCVSTMRVDA